MEAQRRRYDRLLPARREDDANLGATTTQRRITRSTEESLLLAQKPVHGTKDAPRGFWRRRLHLDGSGKTKGIMVSHVDDLLWCGDSDMDSLMSRFHTEFEFGSLETEDSFTYCGRLISQTEYGIKVTCPNLACKVRQISMTSERRSNRGEKATPNEIH